MDKKYIFLTISILIIIAAAVLVYQSQALKRTYKSEVLKGIKRIETSENSILTENDIKHLPEPVQKYLVYVGVIGKEKVNNVRVVTEGEMKMDPKKD